MIFWSQEGTYKSFKQTFEVVDRTTWQVTTHNKGTISSDNYSGYVVQKFIRGNYVFELVQFLESSFTTKCKMGLVKRSVETFEIEGDIVWIGDYKIFNALEIPNLSFAVFNDGFYLLSAPGEKNGENFVSAYDFNLNQTWMKELDFLKGRGMSVKKLRVQQNGELLLEINENLEESTDLENDGIGTKTAIRFLIVTNDHKVTELEPKIDINFLFSHSEYFYDFSKRELIGVYLISGLDKSKRTEEIEGQGYAYYRWGSDGEIKASTSKMLTFGDIWNEDARNYLKELGYKDLPSNETKFPSMPSPFITFHQNENGKIVFTFGRIRTEDFEKNKYNAALMESLYCFELDDEGKFAWQIFIPRSLESDLFAREKFLLYEGNDLHILTSDIEESFQGSDYIVKDSRATENAFGVITTVDVKGDVSRFKIENPKEVTGEALYYLGARSLGNGTYEYMIVYKSKKTFKVSSLKF